MFSNKSIINNFSSLKEKLQNSILGKEIKFAVEQFNKSTSFIGYDLGIAQTKDVMLGDYAKSCKLCNNVENGILNQGMFQTKVLNMQQYNMIKTWYEKYKPIIAKVNVFYLSTSLEDGASPILDVFPIFNLYHSAIGFTFEDENGNIIRSLIMQLEFGAISGMGEIVNRFLTPNMCLFGIKDEKTGDMRSPSTYTEEEFIENLFIDYSHSISGFYCDFLESENYQTDKLVETMGCVNISELSSSAPMPYSGFFNQKMTMNNLYQAYEEQLSGPLGQHGGNADGKIFCLASFGPSPFTSQAGAILNFAQSTDKEMFSNLLDWAFVNYANCSLDSSNNLQHYCIMGVDKIYDVDELSHKEKSKILKAVNNISSDNDFIRQMRGRTTHCNTVCAVIITLMDIWSDANEFGIKMFTNFSDPEVQALHHYMLNPAIPNIPVKVFPKDVTIKEKLKEMWVTVNQDKYLKQAQKDMDRYQSALKSYESQRNNKVIEMPKKPLSAFDYYYLDNKDKVKTNDHKWDYGVSIHDFNTDPQWHDDKKRFYTLYFFIKQVVSGLGSTITEQEIDGSIVTGSLFGKVYYYLLQVTGDSDIAKTIIKTVFSKKSNQKYNYIHDFLQIILILYLIITLKLYDNFYWVTGQPCVTPDNKFQPVTDPYPTVWKIPLEGNAEILLAYIESVIGEYQTFLGTFDFKGKTAGEIYIDNKENAKYNPLDKINSWFHPFPNNKFYLWFPGKKNDEKCEYVGFKNTLYTYIPRVSYDLDQTQKLSKSVLLDRNSKFLTETIQSLLIMVVTFLAILVVSCIKKIMK